MPEPSFELIALTQHHLLIRFISLFIKLSISAATAALVWARMAFAQQQLQRVEEAIDSLSHALSLHPDFWSAREARAHMYAEIGQTAHALE